MQLNEDEIRNLVAQEKYPLPEWVKGSYGFDDYMDGSRDYSGKLTEKGKKAFGLTKGD